MEWTTWNQQRSLGRGGPRRGIHPAGGDEFDVHEALKANVFGARNPRCDDHFEKSRPCPGGVYGVSDHHLVLDSALVADGYPGDRERGVYRFNFMVQGDGRPGVVATWSEIVTVTQIQVFPFCLALPELLDLPTSFSGLTLTSNPGSDDPRADTDPVGGLRSQVSPNCGRVVMELVELGSQSVHDYRGRHHFEFTSELLGDPASPGARMRLTPVMDTYTFTEPIKDIHGLTLRFRASEKELRFPLDRIEGVRLQTGGAGQLLVLAPATVMSSGPIDFSQLLLPGDRVYLEGVDINPDDFTSAASLTAYLNRPEGLFVGANVNTSDFDLDPSVNPAGLGANAAIASRSPLTLRIAKNRMRVPLRVRGVVDRLTNYIAP